MKTRLSLLLLLISFAVFAQNSVSLAIAEPESVGVSSEKLAKIDAHINQWIDDNRLPGGTFLVAKKGKIIYQKNFGFRNSQKETPYQVNDIYRLASMTKAVTCVAVMQLYEQGKIGLDDPVHKYIPAFKDQVVLNAFDPSDSSYTTVPVMKDVTIRNLLTHTSGIVYGGFNPGKLQAVYDQFGVDVGFSHPTLTTEQWVDKLAKVPLAHQPGEKFSYGMSMDVLGRIIEIVSGQSLANYFQEHIFGIVGMKDTHFYLPKDKWGRLVGVYTKAGGKFMTIEEMGLGRQLDYPKRGPRNIYAGGAGLSGTIMDYALFIQSLVSGGGNLLGEEALAEMTRDQMPNVINDYQGPPAWQTDGSFALGFTLYQDKPTKKSPKSPGTYEWGGYFNTKFFIDPREQMIFVGMTQIAGFNQNAFWEDMYKLIYDSINR